MRKVGGIYFLELGALRLSISFRKGSVARELIGGALDLLLAYRSGAHRT